MGAPAARVSELSRHWANAGRDVTVLTAFPNHPDGVIRPEYRRRFRRMFCRELTNGIKVARTWLLPFPNRKPYERMLNYASFCLSAAIAGSLLKPHEVVIATSPQLLVGLSGWWIARVKGSRFVLEVRDLWPESLQAVGVGNANSRLHRFLGKIAGLLYRKADHIVVVTPAFRDYLVQRWNVPGEKISIIQNGVEIGLFRPGDAAALRAELKLDGKFVVSYIGTLGMAHGLETVIAAAERLQAYHPEIVCMLVGEGAERERIAALAQSRALRNILFIGQQPREKVPQYIAAADACLVVLKKTEVFETVIPTKMLEFMSCARPVILGVAGEARKIVEDAECGICFEPGNADALAESILRLKEDPSYRQALGRNGRAYILKRLSRERTAAEYLDLLEQLCGKRARAAAAIAA